MITIRGGSYSSRYIVAMMGDAISWFAIGWTLVIIQYFNVRSRPVVALALFTPHSMVASWWKVSKALEETLETVGDIVWQIVQGNDHCRVDLSSNAASLGFDSCNHLVCPAYWLSVQ